MDFRAGIASTGALVALLLALGLAGPAAAADKAPGRGKGLLLNPSNGERVPARPLAVRVRAGSKAKLKARLNGRAIEHRFFSRKSKHGVRKVQVSPSHGLRHGWNRVHVTRRNTKGKTRSVTRRFLVRRNRPLAAAGLDRRVGGGSGRTLFDGGDTRVHPKAPGHGKPVKYQWEIVRKPRGAGRAQRAAAGAGGGPKLGKPNSPAPALRTEVPGRYTLKLTVITSDGKRGRDFIDTRIDPVPLVEVDTHVSLDGGWTAIQVGTDVHKQAEDSGAWAQIVALDRKTLQPVIGELADLANQTYEYDADSCIRANEPFKQRPCVDLLKSDLARLGSEHLVIVSNPWNGVAPAGIESALGRIGVSTRTQFGDSHGLFSAIGVPGGRGDWHAVARGSAGDFTPGQMRGLLIRNNEGYYTFASSDREEFNTRAAGSNADQNVIELAGKKFTQRIDDDSGSGGFQVVVFDPRSGEGKAHWFETGQPTADRLKQQLNAMRQVIHDANFAEQPMLVAIASLGAPQIRVSGEQVNPDMMELTHEVERLGATRTGFFKALDPGLCKDCSFTLVSMSSSSPARGDEIVASRSAAPGFLNAGPISGMLSRTGPNYGLEPEDAPLIGVDGSGEGADPSRGVRDLVDVIHRPTSRWPEQGDEGRTRALAWIGQTVLGTTNFRGAYWTHPFVDGEFDYTYFTVTLPGQVTALGYPGSKEGFSAQDLSWAKDELRRELEWLVNSHRYMDALATPFTKSTLTSWAAFEQIRTEVANRIGVSDGEARASQEELLESLADLASAVPFAHVGEVFEAVTSIYGVVMSQVSLRGEPAEDEFPFKAAELGTKLIERLNGAQTMLMRQMPNAISADYDKLKTVGSCASSTPTDWKECPFDHSDWQLTQDDQTVSEAFETGLRTWAYGELLDARYSLYRLDPWWRTKVGGKESQFYGITLTDVHYPFEGLPESAQMAKPLYRNFPSYGHTIRAERFQWLSSGESWQVFALGYRTGSGTIIDRYQMHIPSDPAATEEIFKPLSEGGLGADKEAFFDLYFNARPLGNYPEDTTPTGWCAGGPRVPCD